MTELWIVVPVSIFISILTTLIVMQASRDEKKELKIASMNYEPPLIVKFEEPFSIRSINNKQHELIKKLRREKDWLEERYKEQQRYNQELEHNNKVSEKRLRKQEIMVHTQRKALREQQYIIDKMQDDYFGG